MKSKLNPNNLTLNNAPQHVSGIAQLVVCVLTVPRVRGSNLGAYSLQVGVKFELRPVKWFLGCCGRIF